MCLQKVTQVAKEKVITTYDFIKTDRNIGYKVFKSAGKGQYKGRYRDCGIFEIGKTYEAESGVNVLDKLSSGDETYYPSGFHIFDTRKDAREANKDSPAWSCRTAVLKVEYDNVVAIGIETQFGGERKTIIARKMKILGRA